MFLLTEEYFVENKSIEKIQNQLSKLRKKYTIKDSADKICEDIAFYNISELIKNEFGFKYVYFMCDSDDVDVVNAYTIPVSQVGVGRLDKKYIVTKTGIKYKPHTVAKTIIIVTKPLLYIDSITDREVMAIILHEIGHNFYDAVMPIETIIDLLNTTMSFYVSSFTKLLKNKTNIDVNVLKFIKDTFKNPFFSSYRKGTDPLASSEDDAYVRVYKNEKFADNFVAMYGYSKDLSSALIKLHNLGNYPKQSSFYDLMHTIEGVVSFILPSLAGPDPHPMLSARLKSSIELLEYELEHNEKLPNEVKKDLKKQIISIKMLAKQYSTITKKDNYMVAHKLYFKLLYNFFDKGDIDSTLLKDYKIEDIDKTLKDHKK